MSKYNAENTIISVPGNSTPADYLYAWLSVDEQGREGIVANPLPLVCQKKDLADAFGRDWIEPLRRDPRSKGYTFVLAEFKRVK